MTPTAQQSLRLATILGSSREGRFGPEIARWFASLVTRQPEWELDLIDVAELDLPPILVAEPTRTVAALRKRLEAADAFVLILPEYNRGYPAALKHVIDFSGREWRAKPVGIVSYGGQSGGIRAAAQISQVLIELRAVPMRESVILRHPWVDFEDTASEPRDRAAARLLDELAWWATALRRARHPEDEAPTENPVEKERTAEIERFYRHFVEDFAEFDGELIASRYAEPFLAIDAEGGVETMLTRHETAQFFQRHLDAYRDRGVVRCRFTDLETRTLGERCWLATMTWQMLDRQGTVVSSWRGSYSLLRSDSGLQVYNSADFSAFDSRQ